ncbi:MAG: flagellar basal body-associated FliL family protein [Clostridiales bacterium]|jgi:flagellar basal body-associated protein FliL|nr:flagellar basal body-associated FliL family protein [Clostridiales bacterium]
MEENTKGSGGNKGMMFIIMGMLGLIILALAGVAVFLIMNMGAFGGGGEGNGEIIDEGYEAPPGIIDQVLFELDGGVNANIFTRPGGSRSLVHMTLAIGVNNLEPTEAAELVAALSARQPAIASIVGDILRLSTVDSLEAPGGHDALREDIVSALQMHFNTNLIVAVYFQFLIVG